MLSAVKPVYLCYMFTKLSGWDDTIVALATPQGIGAIGVIRLSGIQAIYIANTLFIAKNLALQKSHTVHVGLLVLNAVPLDEVVVTIFKNPKSYTGEDVVEISCHGSQAILQNIINACIYLGARLAKPGEFTQRAFLHGKLDLTQAESVADLIASNTAAQQQAALHNLKGGFKKDLIEIREQLIEFSALMELELDFAEADVAFADRKKFNELLQTATLKVQNLIASFSVGNVVSNGIKVAIVGKPNAGKSTLLNTLLNDERAIVSAIAGTTRDTVEETMNINGILFHFIDTAGIRSHTLDEIEKIGIHKSKEKIEQADIVLWLVDKNETIIGNDILASIQHKKYIVVINKIDEQTIDQTNDEYIYISAKNKIGIQTLTNTLFNKVINKEINTENTLITNTRHLQHLQKIAVHIASIKTGMEQNLTTDLIAPDIKLCLHQIGELTGTITNENVLDYVFSKFCIGK
jgi:tRNA modification GTPase